MRSTLTFCGGAGSVTGSNFLLVPSTVEGLESKTKFLVDCGLFQGCDFCEEANWKEFPYDPKSIALLIVTHAHIDHIGRIPKLVRDGFAGKIISTEATKALAEPLLLDSMELLKSDAKKHGRPVLYDEHDVTKALSLWQGIGYHEPQELSEGFVLELLDAGHIVGSAMAKVRRAEKSIVFTGDLGGTSLLLPPRDSTRSASYLVMESVYGDRTHEHATAPERRAALRRTIEENNERKGTLVIPAFSTERTQEVLFDLREIFAEGKTPKCPVFLDSPLAEKITRAFLANPTYFKKEIREQLQAGENIFAFPELRVLEHAHDSQAAQDQQPPKIIVAGSGMSHGGRVLSHEREILPDPQATLLIVGYQAAGSLGRRLLEGAKQVQIKGEKIKVRCHIETNFGYSAHLDGPHLLQMVEEARETLEEIFVCMGEPASAAFVAQRLHSALHIAAKAPTVGESVALSL